MPVDKLDGLCFKRKNVDSEEEDDAPQSLEQWLQTQVPEDYSYRREADPGKKRVCHYPYISWVTF